MRHGLMLLTDDNDLPQFKEKLADFLNTCMIEKAKTCTFEYGNDEQMTGADGALEKCLKEAAASPLI